MPVKILTSTFQEWSLGVTKYIFCGVISDNIFQNMGIYVYIYTLVSSSVFWNFLYIPVNFLYDFVIM